MTETIVTARRGFLVRALGFTAAGSTIAVPVLALPGADQRFRHHVVEAGRAMRQMFPAVGVSVRGNCLDGHHVHLAERFARGREGHDPAFLEPIACVVLTAGFAVQP